VDFGGAASFVRVEETEFVDDHLHQFSCGDCGSFVPTPSHKMLLGWNFGAFVGYTWKISSMFALGGRFALNLASIKGEDPFVMPSFVARIEAGL
jgi:hypothetical protein